MTLAQRNAAAAIVLEELNHRFLNSLQLIATLAATAGATAGEPPALQARLRRLREVIAALGSLHRMLAQESIGGFEVAGLETCSAVAQAFGRPVALVLEVEAEPEDPWLSRGLLLLLTELVTNALKHGRAGRLGLSVRLSRERGGWRLRVASDAKAPVARPRVAGALADWLGGTLSVTTDSGFAVSVAMPARPAPEAARRLAA